MQIGATPSPRKCLEEGMMFEHFFTAETIVPAPREEVFAFFSSATNLARITPPSLGFHIVTAQPITMAEGTLIDYRISLHGVPMRWRTLIRKWNPPHEFVDVQLKGPYRIWEHHHEFLELSGHETLMKDRVRYALPLPPFGEVALPLVRAEIRGIFAFRQKTITEVFQKRAD